MRYAIAATVIALLGCGSSVNPELEGSWPGSTTVVFSGLNPISYEGALRLRIEGDQVRATGFCPGGLGEVFAQGEGSSFAWSGVAVCTQPVAFPDCNAVHFTFTSAQGRVRPVSSPRNAFALDLSASGFGSGCDEQRGVTLGFSGVKS
jgi:hypothetical protein